jgi:hydroxyacylglutathione hydrolase
MPQVYADEQLTIELLPSLGYNGNNVYILRPANGEGAVTIVDAPEGSEATIEAVGDQAVERIVVTHFHADHWAGYDILRTAYPNAPVYSGEHEVRLDEVEGLQRLSDGDTFHVGDAQVQVLFTPGHSPGSISLLTGGAVLVGDVLFPGGPGRTRDPEALATSIESITTRLYTLPDETLVLPGHGATTTIGDSRKEYEVFASKEHDPELSGDVLWLES